MPAAKRGIVLLALLTFLSAAVSAQTFSADVDIENPRVSPAEGDSAEMNISVTNHGEEAATFEVNYNAAKPGWYFLTDYALTIGPGETKHAVLYAYPDSAAVAGNIGVLVKVSSDTMEVTKRPSYTIVRDSDIMITDMKTDSASYEPGSDVNVTLTLKNVLQRELSANEYQGVFTLGDETQTVTVSPLLSSGISTLETSFSLGKHLSGVKSIVARVESIDGEVQSQKTANIRIEETEKIVKERDRSSNLLISEGSVTVKNEGNVPSGTVEVSESLPFYMGYFATFDPEPSRERFAEGGEKVYTWELPGIEPGEMKTVSYTVNYWAPLLLLILVLGSIGLALREYRKPHIVKRVYRKDGTHSVHLRVENRSRKKLENVVVKDFIPSICSLVEKFDASAPEKIRQGGETTELEWDLESLEPGEERILTYTISSQVEVEQEVTLPSAHLEYDSRGKDKKRHSHPARADFS
ncbi:MAG: hypothetical protein MUP63_02955 [Candidatus Nanohaloarchaeota archaeon QJJ-7]|nr:hypothetical protein [Candidatus Nanohaloarchaeota archaeon QJJ-7]